MMWVLGVGGNTAVMVGVIGAAVALSTGGYNTGASPRWALPVFVLSVVFMVAGVVAILYPVGVGIVSWIL